MWVCGDLYLYSPAKACPTIREAESVLRLEFQWKRAVGPEGLYGEYDLTNLTVGGWSPLVRPRLRSRLYQMRHSPPCNSNSTVGLHPPGPQ